MDTFYVRSKTIKMQKRTRRNDAKDGSFSTKMDPWCISPIASMTKQLRRIEWCKIHVDTTINHIKNGIFPLKMKGDDRVDVSLLTPFLTQRQSLLYIPQHHVIIRHIIGWLLLWGGFRSAYSCCNLSSLCIKKWKFHVILPVKNGHKTHTNNDSSSPTTLL
jgi:hypothetical protein